MDVELTEQNWPRKQFPVPVTQPGVITLDLTRIERVAGVDVEAKSKVHTTETVKKKGLSRLKVLRLRLGGLKFKPVRAVRSVNLRRDGGQGKVIRQLTPTVS